MSDTQHLALALNLAILYRCCQGAIYLTYPILVCVLGEEGPEFPPEAVVDLENRIGGF